MTENNSLKHLLKLADDPDEDIWQQVRLSILKEVSGDQLKMLNDLWAKSENPLQADRLQEIIDEVRFLALISDFEQFIQNRHGDLLDGVTLITRLLNDDFNKEELIRLITPLQKDIWLELNERLTALEKVRIINHLFFEKHQLQKVPNIDSRSIHMYIPTLIKTRRGHAITICTLFVLVARMLDLPVFKVNSGDLPALAYIDAPGYSVINHDQLEQYPTLFFMMMNDQVEVFGKKQFTEYINHLYPTSNQRIELVNDTKLLQSILTKMKLQYDDEQNLTRKAQITKLLSLFK